MVNFEKLYDVVWQYCNDLLNVEVIRADQAGARPATRPYLTFKVLTGPTATGMDDERTGDAGSTKVAVSNEGQRDITISFNSYGSGAGQLMGFLQSVLRSNLGREKLNYLAREKGISLAFIDSPTMQDFTSLIQSEYEERFQMDAIFRTVSIFGEEVSFIESAIIGTSKAEADAGDPAIRDQNGTVKAPGKVTIN